MWLFSNADLGHGRYAQHIFVLEIKSVNVIARANVNVRKVMHGHTKMTFVLFRFLMYPLQIHTDPHEDLLTLSWPMKYNLIIKSCH